MSQEESDLFGSMACIGAMIGALLGTWLLKVIGRKAALQLCALPYAGGAVLQAVVRHKNKILRTNQKILAKCM